MNAILKLGRDTKVLDRIGHQSKVSSIRHDVLVTSRSIGLKYRSSLEELKQLSRFCIRCQFNYRHYIGDVLRKNGIKIFFRSCRVLLVADWRVRPYHTLLIHYNTDTMYRSIRYLRKAKAVAKILNMLFKKRALRYKRVVPFWRLTILSKKFCPVTALSRQ